MTYNAVIPLTFGGRNGSKTETSRPRFLSFQDAHCAERQLIMTKIEEIRARAEAEIKRAEAEIGIRSRLPVEPEFVHVHPLWGSVASVSYKVDSRQSALEIAQQFAIVPAYICRKGTVSIKPYEDASASDVSEIHAWVACEPYGAKLEFYAQLGEDIIRVDIRMPLRLFGAYTRDNPKARINYKLSFNPLPKTNEMFMAIRYAPLSYRGPDSWSQVVFAIYDSFELENFAG